MTQVMNLEIVQTIARELSNFRHVIITTHVNPDADAIGSALGMSHLLDMITKGNTQSTIVLPTQCPTNLLWLPGADKMRVWDESGTLPNGCNQLPNADCVIVLDLNTISRLQSLGEALIASGLPIINIDHHTFPENFAHIQWIDTESASTAQMVAVLLNRYVQIDAGLETNPLMASIAMCLYTGIMSDTGSFRFPRTTPFVFEVAGRLVKYGADPVAAYEQTFNTNSFKRMQLLGSALAGMRLHHNGKLCTMVVTQKEMQEFECSVEDTEGLVHHTLSITGVVVGILFIELPDTVKCSFRSKGNVHIRSLAAQYGGGGHVHAAGARVNDRTLTDVYDEMTTRVKDVLSEP